MLIVSAGTGCTLNEVITWSDKARVKVTFDIRGCYNQPSYKCEGWTGPAGPGAGDREQFSFEPFRQHSSPTTSRETPDMWWTSTASEYGYGLGTGHGWSKGAGLEKGTTHNPNQWHTWEIVFHNPHGSNLYIESWTVDGESKDNTAAYLSTFIGKGKHTSALGFAGHPGTRVEVRNLAINHAATGLNWAFADGDPHLALPHGGKADFRGEDKALYNFLSAPSLSLNVMTELADFELHAANHSLHKHVHGSFLTQAHIVARTDKGTTVKATNRFFLLTS